VDLRSANNGSQSIMFVAFDTHTLTPTHTDAHTREGVYSTEHSYVADSVSIVILLKNAQIVIISFSPNVSMSNFYFHYD
jgi:hypothetical protein